MGSEENRKHNITKNVLEEMYLKRRMSSLQIGEALGIPPRTIRKKLKKFGVQTRTLSEAGIKHAKSNFDNDEKMHAYLLGLRAGDVHAKTIHKVIRVQTTTTRNPQINMMKQIFGRYANVSVYAFHNKTFKCKESFVYADLLPSFSFLLQKPESIPHQIMKDDNLFTEFLAAYSDCEASWKILKSHKQSVRYVFSLKTCDSGILEDIQTKLRDLGIYAHLYLEYKKGESPHPSGKYPYNKNLYGLTIYKKNDIEALIRMLLPRSRHEEKVRKMGLILNSLDADWSIVESRLLEYKKWFKEGRTSQ